MFIHKENVTLDQAFATTLEKQLQVWEVAGLHVTCQKLPENIRLLYTFVMKTYAGKCIVGVHFNEEGKLGSQMHMVAKFDTLNLTTLKEHFPKLFELKGNLF